MTYYDLPLIVKRIKFPEEISVKRSNEKNRSNTMIFDHSRRVLLWTIIRKTFISTAHSVKSRHFIRIWFGFGREFVLPLTRHGRILEFNTSDRPFHYCFQTWFVNKTLVIVLRQRAYNSVVFKTNRFGRRRYSYCAHLTHRVHISANRASVGPHSARPCWICLSETPRVRRTHRRIVLTHFTQSRRHKIIINFAWDEKKKPH